MVETVNDPKVGTLFVEQGAEPLVMDPKGLKDFMTLKTRNGPGSSRRSASSRCEGHTRLDLPRLSTSPAPLSPTILPCSYTTRPRAMVVTGQPVTSKPSHGV